MSKPNIIICIPLVWSIRNFILNDLNKELEQKYNVYYAIPPVAKGSLAKYGIDADREIILEESNRTKQYTFLDSILKLAHDKRNPSTSNKVFGAWFSRDKKNLPITTKVKKSVYGLLSLLIMPKSLFKSVERRALKEFDKGLPNSLKEKINSLKPEFILSTAFVVNWEWAILRAAKQSGAKAYSFVLSFDNLTSRGYLPLSFFDKYLVWNSQMQDELVNLYEISHDKITITGTPQFDYHLNPKYLKTREELLKHLDFNTDDKYIVYCANHISLTPNEPELLDEILSAINAEPKLSQHKVVLRLHPMDDYNRWKTILKTYPNVTLNLPWVHDNEQAIYWGNPSFEEVMMYSNILKHSDCTINIASTVSIDASMVNCPVTCVAYHPNKGSIEDKTYHDYHYTEHYKPIIDTQAVDLATDVNEVINSVINYINNKDYRIEGRNKLNNTLLNQLDGKSKERILAVING